ncbi:helix-turn-helix domain-containing protein [Microbacterium sp. LWH13-1.2]|uniref:PucR family transcriptional regulator n=1 Tax=Microbacterium sp. LWH13-1.2 TaxID=3135260 RepID=UPI003139D78E
MSADSGWYNADLLSASGPSVASLVWPEQTQATVEHHAGIRPDLIPLPAGGGATSLQDLVDELSDVLGRSVMMQDSGFRLVAASAQADDVDELQVRTLLTRTTPQAEREWAEQCGVTRTRHPLTVDFAEFGAHERFIIPVWADDEPLGTIWLIKTGFPPLREDEFRAIDATVTVASSLLQARSRGAARNARESIFRSLLAGDAASRREALAAAVRSHGITRGPETVVRAITVEENAPVIQRAALGQALENTARQALFFIGELGAALLFVGRHGVPENIDALITSEADRAGVALKAIGSAALSPNETDLLPVAGRAVATAAVVEMLPELGTSAHADDVGPWLFLADVLVDPERLQWYSPAAHTLIHDPDPMRRQTVEVLLDTANHVRDVCETLHIHRTTLYYRLENMPPVVKEALDNGMQRSALHLALKLATYWENAGHIR